MKILAVDDDPTALNILELALQTAGYDAFDLAKSSTEALGYLDRTDTPYDCLLLDIIMPEMDGVELCRHVREMPSYAHVPIIMITASQHKETLTSAILSGATDYINKPFDGLELVTRLRAAESLMKATKSAKLPAQRDPAPTEEKSTSDLQLADGFALVPKTGLVSQADLVCEFMETAQYFKSVHCFGVAISDVKRLFDRMPNSAFRAFVNELAETILRTTQLWDARIAYVGDGTFVVVLFDVGFVSNKDLHKVLQASLGASTFEGFGPYTNEARICVDYIGVSDPDMQIGVDALFKAADNAKRKADNRMAAERELEIRYEVLGRAQAGSTTHYEVSLTKAAPTKIVPRRLSKHERADFAVGKGSSVIGVQIKD